MNNLRSFCIRSFLSQSPTKIFLTGRNSLRINHQVYVSSSTILSNTETLPAPACNYEEKEYPHKIKGLVDEISQLTLLEVADLNELLKKTLNIPDMPMMGAGIGFTSPVTSEKAEEMEEVPAKTLFKVRLTGFDQTKKVALIKEIKSLLDDMNLVQAKKFVESAPQDVKIDLSKDEAEKLKLALETVGGECIID